MLFFLIANEVLSGMDLLTQSQSIIITGESGAGKTETTKQLLEYLCFLSKKEDKIITKINEANLLLECLGNAQTEKNCQKFAQLILYCHALREKSLFHIGVSN